MTGSQASQQRLSRIFLVALAIGISVVFFFMIRGFLIAVLLAGIFSAWSQPVYLRLLRLFRGRKAPASITVICIVLLVIVIPLTAFLGVVGSQAIGVSQSVRPWIEQQLSEPDQLDELLARIPYFERLRPYQDQIVAKIGELAGTTGTFLASRVAAATRGTVTFLLNLFIMLYAMFFFLIGGRAILNKILYYMPLSAREEDRMVGRFVSVTRATVKGTLVIGIIQGGLAGLAFYIAGVAGAAFWGTVMAVLSIIPGVGTALVWIPAVIYLIATGKLATAIALGVWCGVVVGTVDNVLRPRLVGRDTKMSDLLILLSTIGGILLFGAVGVIIGPIVAALFITVWEIYGETFKEFLPAVPGAAGLEGAGGAQT